MNYSISSGTNTEIAESLIGRLMKRSQNCVKNRFYSNIKRKLKSFRRMIFSKKLRFQLARMMKKKKKRQRKQN